MSDPQDVEDNGKNPASSNNSDDPSNNSGSRCITDGRGTVTALKPAQTAGNGDQHAIESSLDDVAIMNGNLLSLHG